MLDAAYASVQHVQLAKAVNGLGLGPRKVLKIAKRLGLRAWGLGKVLGLVFGVEMG